MDHPSVLLAAGLPMAFDHFETAGTTRSGLPANLEPLTATQPTDAPG
jgi:hypothetical protein